MQKNKEYKNTIFPVETLKKAITEFEYLAKTDKTIEVAKALSTKKEKQTDEELLRQQISREMRIRQLNETWTYDSEDEFFGDYRKYDPHASRSYFYYRRSLIFHTLDIESELGTDCVVRVSFNGDLDCRSAIERIFDIFETDAQKSKLPYEVIVKPKIFIGHGRSTSWRDLKDHLHDKHSYEVVISELPSASQIIYRRVIDEKKHHHPIRCCRTSPNTGGDGRLFGSLP